MRRCTRRFPKRGRQIQDEADALLAGRFDLLGYRDLTFGEPIDWQLDPVWSRRAPLAHWSQIDPLDVAMVGDSKVVWELNRHQWVVASRAGIAITGDEPLRHGRRRARSTNGSTPTPSGVGINWASSLEVAFRLIAWSWALALLRDTGGRCRPPFATRLFAVDPRSRRAHPKRICPITSRRTRTSREKRSGCSTPARCFREFRDAAAGATTGARILVEQSRMQISDDGVYFEQSTGYQRYTVEIYLHFLLLAAAQRHRRARRRVGPRHAHARVPRRRAPARRLHAGDR